MAGSPPGGIISWERSPKDDKSPPPKRRAPYVRSIGWAIVAWLVAFVVLFLIAQFPSLSDLLPWLAGRVSSSGVGSVVPMEVSGEGGNGSSSFCC